MQEAPAQTTHPQQQQLDSFCLLMSRGRATIHTGLLPNLSDEELKAAKSCLYRDDYSCGKVRDPHSRVGGVDMLTSCASCPVGVYPQILVPHRDINLHASPAP